MVGSQMVGELGVNKWLAMIDNITRASEKALEVLSSIPIVAISPVQSQPIPLLFNTTIAVYLIIVDITKTLLVQ